MLKCVYKIKTLFETHHVWNFCHAPFLGQLSEVLGSKPGQRKGRSQEQEEGGGSLWSKPQERQLCAGLENNQCLWNRKMTGLGEARLSEKRNGNHWITSCVRLPWGSFADLSHSLRAWVMSTCETKQVKGKVQLLSLRGEIEAQERNCNQRTFPSYDSVSRSIDLTTRAGGCECMNIG